MRLPGKPVQPWARLLIVRGSDPHTTSFYAGQPRQLRIGSAPGTELQLPASCAAPLQLEAYWDGATLWLQDRLRLGTTLVRGRPLGEWSAVRGQVLVSFGKIRMWVVAASSEPLPAAPDLSWLDHARGGSAAWGARRMPTMRLMRSSLFEVEARACAREQTLEKALGSAGEPHIEPLSEAAGS